MSFCLTCQSQKIIISSNDEFIVSTTCDTCAKDCHLCKGKGFHVTERNGYEYVNDCSCKSFEHKARLLTAAKIPALYKDKLKSSIKTSSTYIASSTQTESQEKVLAWAKQYTRGSNGFILEGSFGTGKTMMLCQALSILTLQEKVSCLYIDFSLLMQELKQKISNKESASDLYHRLRSVSVLAVDELGKVRGTEWELSELDMLISQRYQSSQTTLFATNFPEQELTARIGGKLASRIAEKCSKLLMNGDDFRVQHRSSI